jgi:hypothetical protein
MVLSIPRPNSWFRASHRLLVSYQFDDSKARATGFLLASSIPYRGILSACPDYQPIMF